MAKQPQTKALTKYDAELAALAEAAAKQEANTGGGRFFSLRSGTLKLNDAPIPNNEMACIIVDSVLENVYYQGAFDPENPQAPDCYAFGRDEDTMVPHDEVENKQCEACADCELNKWGSAEQGRGKACRNRRRLALIPGGTFSKDGEFTPIDDPDAITRAEVAYLNVPPTSINSFGAYVKQVVSAVKRPPSAVFTRVALAPDDKTQFKLVFELLEPLPNELVAAALEKARSQQDQTGFPYAKAQEKSERQQKPAKRPLKPAPRRY